MNIKNNWVSITIVVIILIIFLLILFAKANERLDKYEERELETSYQQYLSKGA